MKEILAAVTLAVTFTAAAQTASAPQEQGHQARL
jgi:opacity protein-like surface antigen